MAIDITIQTTYAQLVDANGKTGFGHITVRPNKAFTYESSGTISVTNASTRIEVENGVFSSPTTFTLAPNYGNTNVPVTHYIVDINLNGTTQRIKWQMDGSTLTYEFSDVPLWNNAEDASASTVTPADLAAYQLRTDMAATKTASAASDGRGYGVLADPVSGYIPKAFLFTGASGTDSITGDDIPISDASITATDAEAALVENRALIDTNTTDTVRNVAGGGILSGYVEGAFDPANDYGANTWGTRVSVSLQSIGTYLIFFSCNCYHNITTAGPDAQVSGMRLSGGTGVTFSTTPFGYSFGSAVTDGQEYGQLTGQMNVGITGAGDGAGNWVVNLQLKSDATAGVASLSAASIISIKIA